MNTCLSQIENINVYKEEPLISPGELKSLYPISDAAIATVSHGQQTIKNILDRKDPRLFVVVGPCSIHDLDAAKDYAQKLRWLADKVQQNLFLIMRVYFEKPRTRTGWQGFINDPYLDDSYQIEAGLKSARSLLLHISELGLPIAGEALDLVSPPYLQDLVSWTAIGARTTESQSHRKMASGFSSAVGFKNGTDGNVDIAINAVHSAAKASHFLSVDQAGDVSVIRTKGNPYAHIVLRGGGGQPNYDQASLANYENTIAKSGLVPNIMIDCSHDNSFKKAHNQAKVVRSVMEQIKQGNQSIIGLMLESNLNAGKQPIPKDLKDLKYGVSITDECICWEETESMLLRLDEELGGHLNNRKT